MKQIRTRVFAIFVTLTLVLSQAVTLLPAHGPLHWDWSEVALDDINFYASLSFPANFGWGVGDSAFQTEGTLTAGGRHIENNWTVWLREHGKPPVGVACDRWNRWPEDIDRIIDLGFNTYRLSVEWAKIHPEPDRFDYDALQHYIDMCQYAQSKGLNLVIVLWHHTWPVWFGDKGGFENKANIKYFLNYCAFVCAKLHPYVRTWIPFNEPDGYAMAAYFQGSYPPGIKTGSSFAERLERTGRVIKNMLNAHVQAARVIKKIDSKLQVGITKVVQHLDPYRWWHPIERLVASIFDYLVNTTTINFFKTGHFVWYIPGVVDVRDYNKYAHNSIDFFGVNYYSHTNVKINLMPPGKDTQAQHAWQTRTADGHLIYPEGLSRAIERCSVIGKPLIITENGVGDSTDQYREKFIKQHVYVVHQALADGYDIRGYHYWSYCDNFEWMHGYENNFGLVKVTFDTKQLPRALKPGAQEFCDFVKRQTLAAAAA